MSYSVFGHPFSRLFWSPVISSSAGDAAAAMDWLETTTSHIIKIDVPGYGKEHIKVQLEDGDVLSIRGDLPAEEQQPPKEAVWHVAERGRGGREFLRRFRLPDNVRADQIKAQVENGVLTVILPKEPVPAKPKPRTIAVSSKL